MLVIPINELWKTTEYYANKSQTGAQVSPVQFNDSVPVLTNKLVDIYAGNVKEYRPGFPIAASAFEVTQIVRDYISLYLKNEVIRLQDPVTGYVTPPDDHLNFSAAAYKYYEQGDDPEDELPEDLCTCGSFPCKCGTKKGVTTNYIASKIQEPRKANLITCPVTILNDQQWYEIMSHSFLAPDQDHPSGRFLENTLQVAPSFLGRIWWAYLRYPKRPFWNSDPDISPGIATYVAAGSQDVELPLILLDELALCICDRLGLNVREMMLQEYAERKRKNGL